MTDEKQTAITAPRVTVADIKAQIAAEYSTTLDRALSGCPLMDGMDRVTLYVIVMRNGTKVVGVNYGAISAELHDPDIGVAEARSHAMEQIWPLLGYELRTRLASSLPGGAA